MIVKILLFLLLYFALLYYFLFSHYFALSFDVFFFQSCVAICFWQVARARERDRLRQWFFNRFSEIFFFSLSSIRIKRQMKRWLKLLSKSNPKRKNACHRNKETNKTNKCGLRQNRSVPLPFHSPYSKYTTKINKQFQLEQKKIQIYSNPSKKHPSQQKQQHIPHRMATNTQCNTRTSTRTHATSIGDRRKMNDAAAAKKMTNHSKSPETICQALLLMCFIRNTLVCARSILKRKYNHCVAAWCVCISFHFNLVDHTKCFFFLLSFRSLFF